MCESASLFFWCVLMVCAFSANCNAGVDDMAAYLDPGTGAFIFQILIAGIVGFGFAIKLFWHHIKKFFLGLFGKKMADSEKDERIKE